METPGTLLKAAREKRELDLDDIAQVTRISKTILVQLERDEFEELPAEVFVRGFLRNVARELKLDSEEIIDAYEEHTGHVYRSALDDLEEEEPEESELPKPKLTKGSSLPSRRMFPSWDRVIETIGSAKPGYVIASLVVILALALAVSVFTTSGIPMSDSAPKKATWNVKADGPKAPWILNGQSNIAGAATV